MKILPERRGDEDCCEECVDEKGKWRTKVFMGGGIRSNLVTRFLKWMSSGAARAERDRASCPT